LNIFQHIKINIKGNFIKLSVLLLSFTVISTLVVFSILTHQSALQADLRLQRTLPTVIHIRHTYKEFRLENRMNFIKEVVNPIASHEGVIFYEYMIEFHGLSRDLRPIAGSMNLPEPGEFHVRIPVLGFSNSEIIYFTFGNLKLINGRNFNENEIIRKSDGPIPAIISYAFAQQNSLNAGDIINIGLLVIDPIFPLPILEKEDLKYFNYEVIGIWDFEDRVFNEWMFNQQVDGYLVENELYSWIQGLYESRIFVPYWAVQDAKKIILEHRNTYLSSAIDAYFILSDPVYTLDFLETVQRYIPTPENFNPHGNFYHNLSDRFSHFTQATNFIINVLFNVRIITIIVGTILMSLLNFMYLLDRKKELGIYIALGFSKLRILKIFITEIVIITTFATVLSFLTGSILSSQLSQNILENEINNFISLQSQESNYSRLDYTFGITVPNLTAQEMAEYFELTFEIADVALISGINLIIVIISTSIPVIKFFSIQPKKILEN